MEASSHLQTLLIVGRKDARSQTKIARVDNADTFLVVVVGNLDNRHDGAKDFLIENVHFWSDATQNSGLEELPVQTGIDLSTTVQGGALLDGVIHQRLDDFQLARHDHASAINLAIGSAGCQRVALSQSLDSGNYLRQEFIVNRLIDHHAFDAHTVLARVLKASAQDKGNHVGNLDIVSKDHGVLSAQLQYDGSQILGGRSHDEASNRGRSRKDNLVD
mmetsp:Transcript_10784/g.27286  ORF Transcript_10784/g.27286 Transcript_10784/m.27286 type:complete len:218 (-) Transcript_10784:957-1610(-)